MRVVSPLRRKSAAVLVESFDDRRESYAVRVLLRGHLVLFREDLVSFSQDLAS
jgi:hypothetical protein